ncbi:hypothetical protein PIROE2DRAFT_9851 [Piromyces sp. E2]|nr:hypothetical protein PIROE2DRAFT_9851 [Piromyces sp. E2]|eukprot:OUM63570.1 hypothetical protein PIROE2DRAFT_9851 [Piromyces sp. E2]
MRFNIRRIVTFLTLILLILSVSNTAPVTPVDMEKRGIVSNIKDKIKDVGGKIKDLAEGAVTTVLHAGNNIAVKLGIDTAKFGAKVLDMQKDKNGIYHADFNCWQKHFGYNKFFDFMFDLGTSMDYNNEGMFKYDGKNYILWAWKGDYINLGAGAELGIYKGGKNRKDHWDAAPDKAMPMTLTLTHKTKGTIVNKWNNNGAPTWWITAFNPKYRNLKSKDLTATFTVTFKDTKMYKAFEKTKSKGWKYDSKKHTATLVL